METPLGWRCEQLETLDFLRVGIVTSVCLCVSQSIVSLGQVSAMHTHTPHTTSTHTHLPLRRTVFTRESENRSATRVLSTPKCSLVWWLVHAWVGQKLFLLKCNDFKRFANEFYPRESHRCRVVIFITNPYTLGLYRTVFAVL